DGIRDGHVTGVQTCALPIFGQCRDVEVRFELPMWRRGCRDERTIRRHKMRRNLPLLAGIAVEKNALLPVARVVGEQRDLIAGERSEERRVGKECRDRWSADQ